MNRIISKKNKSMNPKPFETILDEKEKKLDEYIQRRLHHSGVKKGKKK